MITRTLLAHPQTPRTMAAAFSLTASVEPQRRALVLRWVLAGKLDTLRVPPPAPQPRAVDGLWRHTCFEVFVANTTDHGYVEFNLSPSGDWAVYAFSAPRVRSRLPCSASVRAAAWTRTPHALTLEATLEHGAGDGAAGLSQLGLSAVLEEVTGELGYWALRHPDTVPDFHDRRGWTVERPIQTGATA